MDIWSWLFILAIAVSLDLFLVRLFARRSQGKSHQDQGVWIMGTYSPTITWLKKKSLRFQEMRSNFANRTIDLHPRGMGFLKWPMSFVVPYKRAWMLGEIVTIIIWAMVITGPYLNLNPKIFPTGLEYPSAIQTHHLWTRIKECGACAMWNGSERGGAPYFADPHGSMLHPLVITTTLIWGVQNGAKMALVAMFILAGLAQWWLARIMGLSWPARLWSSLMAVTGGHLAVRMELGAFGVVLSTVMCALILPPLIWLLRSNSRRAAIALGVFLALAILAGQGYMQIGLVMAIFPAAIFLVPNWDRERLKMLLGKLLLAGIIALLLSAVFLVPLLHFMPQFDKEMDPAFGSAQPFEYIPLNLVVRDLEFLSTPILDKTPYPHLHGNYIGWFTVILAIYALFSTLKRDDRKVVNFLFASAVLAMWVSSARPLIWIIQLSPFPTIDHLIAGIRNPAQIAGLAGFALIGLAAIGLDKILTLAWPVLQFSWLQSKSASSPITFNTRWLIVLPLAASLFDMQDFSKAWIGVVTQDPTVPIINLALRTDYLEWVNPPFGQHQFIESAVGMGLKMNAGVRTWYWKARRFPEPILEANPVGPPAGMDPFQVVQAMQIYKGPPEREYAQIHFSTQALPTICQASGNSGDINVICPASKPGTLVIKENNWTGWYVKLDGARAGLEPGDWLAVALPAGVHNIEFRYRPWDVPLGIGLSILGIFIVIVLWRRSESLLSVNDADEISTVDHQADQPVETPINPDEN